MKLSTTTYRPAFTVLIASVAVAALAACSSSPGSTGETGTKGGSVSSEVTQPAGTTKVVQMKNPEGISSDLHFTVGRNDSFVDPSDLAAGSRGLVVSVTNTGKEPVELGSRLSFGDDEATSTSDDSVPSGSLVADKTPKECTSDAVTANQATINTGGSADSTTVTIDAGKTYFGCGVLGLAALPEGTSDLRVGIVRIVNDVTDPKTVTVDTGNTFGN